MYCYFIASLRSGASSILSTRSDKSLHSIDDIVSNTSYLNFKWLLSLPVTIFNVTYCKLFTVPFLNFKIFTYNVYCMYMYIIIIISEFMQLILITRKRIVSLVYLYYQLGVSSTR